MLGDSLTDTDVTNEIPYDHVITVGFPNSRGLEAEAKYHDSFDALVLGPGHTQWAHSLHCRPATGY